MIENFDDGTEKQEATNEHACREEAVKNNYTVEQADNCENGDLKCVNCPFEIVSSCEWDELEAEIDELKIREIEKYWEWKDD